MNGEQVLPELNLTIVLIWERRKAERSGLEKCIPVGIEVWIPFFGSEYL